VLATYLGAPILVDYGRHLVATFHPELSADARVHRLFLSKLAGNGSGVASRRRLTRWNCNQAGAAAVYLG